MMEEIDKSHLNRVCRMGEGKNCCRYIIAHPDYGIVCAKDGSTLQQMLDARVASMTAQGDNCPGWPKVAWFYKPLRGSIGVEVNGANRRQTPK